MNANRPNKKDSKLMTVKNLTESSADLYIYGEIVDNSDWKWDNTDVMPNDVINALDKVDGLNELNIYINSPGGSVFAGLAIYNVLKRNKATKNVYVDGVAASIASVIALAADNLYVPENAFLMIHKPWTMAVGNSDFLRNLATELDEIESGIMNVYEENLAEGVGIEDIKSMVEGGKDKWLNGGEVTQYFKANIVDSKKFAACAKDYLAKYDNVPNKLLEAKQPDEPTPKPPKEPTKDLKALQIQNELDLLSL